MDHITRDSSRLYRLGAVAALVVVGALLFDIGLSMAPGWGPSTVPAQAQAWFAQFDANPLLGIRNLDLLNVVASLVALPMYVALSAAQRRTRPGSAQLALVFVVAGTVLFAASNAALPMLDLSRRYAVAASGAERAALVAAGEALLARGAHGSFGAFPGFFVSEIGTLLMAATVLRSRFLGRVSGVVGVAGAGLLTAYSVAMTFAAGSDALIGALAVPGGLLMIAWQVLVARALFRLAAAREPVPAVAGHPAGARPAAAEAGG